MLCSAKLVLYDEQRDRTFEREISTTSPFTFTVPDNGGHDIALVIFMYDFRYLPLVPMPQVCYATADYEVDPYWTFASDEPDENGVFHPHYGHICMEVTLYTTRGLLDNHNGTIYGYEGDPQLEIVEEYIRQIEESSGERIVVWGYGNSEYNNVRYYRESPDPSSWDLEKIKAGFIS
ncbi:MAG: hypothetical protein J5750_08140 [Clostridiales bacterium]|nr:hypothetical protein [Clostridiales bacterium]